MNFVRLSVYNIIVSKQDTCDWSKLHLSVQSYRKDRRPTQITYPSIKSRSAEADERMFQGVNAQAPMKAIVYAPLRRLKY